jgi:hypothetical protein
MFDFPKPVGEGFAIHGSTAYDDLVKLTTRFRRFSTATVTVTTNSV